MLVSSLLWASFPYLLNEHIGLDDLQIASHVHTFVQFLHLEHMENSNDENLNEAHHNLENTISFHAGRSNVGE